MLLFLDVISPIPEFSVIDENKIIFSKKIIDKNQDKLSDKIIPCYLEINKSLDLENKVTKIIVTTGPGSYTSLRIGISFATGLNYSKNIKVAGSSCYDHFNYITKDMDDKKVGIYIISANSQKFFCYKSKKNLIKFLKIDNNNFDLPQNIEKIYYNYSPLEIKINNIDQIKFSFVKNIINNASEIYYNQEDIIKPIYISNNKILN